MLPLFKKKSPWAPANYRGVHLTSQVGKAIERLLQRSFGNHLTGSEVAGFNQFAYRRERGARDMLALLVLLKLGSHWCYPKATSFNLVDALCMRAHAV